MNNFKNNTIMKTSKAIIALLILLIGARSANAQYVAIPDTAFGSWLNANSVAHNYSACMTGNNTTGWYLDTTCTAVINDSVIDCRNAHIQDLTGIQYFKNLKRLFADSNQLSSLHRIPTTVSTFSCQQCGLTSLASLPPNLVSLVVPINQLTSLPPLPASLINLECGDNLLPTLPALPANLLYLYCGAMNSASLPGALPTTLPSGLVVLHCPGNHLTSLPTLPGSLQYLNCLKNQISSLPTLPQGLKQLLCQYNQLSAIPTLHDSLIDLFCNNNPGLSCLPNITINHLAHFFIDSTGIQCVPSRFTASNYDLRPDSLPVCGVGNANGCAIYNYVLIPDTNFGVWLNANGYSGCMTGSSSTQWYLDTTCSAVLSDTIVSCVHANISDLTGIQYFKSLRILNCLFNNLTSLPALPSGLISLNCSVNQLTSLPILSPPLTSLSCAYNQISTISSLPYTLRNLSVNHNLTLGCLPVIHRGTLDGFYIDSTNIQCMPNYFLANSYDRRPDSLPICGVGNANGCAVFTPDSLVWPGDADANRLVDNNDLLPIGLAYDSTGPARTVQSIVWQGDAATDWSNNLPGYSTTVNYKHADCNGDGTVNASDTSAILQNFSLTHSKTAGYNPVWRSGAPKLSISYSKDTVVVGDTLITTFTLGDSSTQTSAIYGLAFTHNYDPNVLDSNSVSFSFANSWLGNSSNSINIHKVQAAQGTIKAAITGINHTSRSGAGPIAFMRCIITTDNINGKDISYYRNLSYISDITAIDVQGNTIQLNAGIDSNEVGFYPTVGIEEPTGIAKVSIYPNPAVSQVSVFSDAPISQVTLTNMLGQTVIQEQGSLRQTEILDVRSLSKGVYTVHVQSQKGSGMTKLIINR